MNNKPTECIPKGMYCYTRLGPPDSNGRSKVAICPYLSWYYDPTINNRIPKEHDCEEAHTVPYCAFLEQSGLDAMLLWDDCKECDENLSHESDDF